MRADLHPGDPARSEAMEDEFIEKMSDKVGIDKSTATKVVEFLKDHADEAVAFLKDSSLVDKLPFGDKIKGLF
jgi:hypothetical protein